MPIDARAVQSPCMPGVEPCVGRGFVGVAACFGGVALFVVVRKAGLRGQAFKGLLFWEGYRRANTSR
jgi:hypothetical protein